MGKFIVYGGKKLKGEVNINGAKNSILPILAASLLNSGKSVIHNCPRISDTFMSIKILESIGCKVKFENNTISIDSSSLNNYEIPSELVKEMRSSIIFLSAVLSRLKIV